ncbi:unnamed protein product [Gadus morhua 'NCC']
MWGPQRPARQQASNQHASVHQTGNQQKEGMEGETGLVFVLSGRMRQAWCSPLWRVRQAWCSPLWEGETGLVFTPLESETGLVFTPLESETGLVFPPLESEKGLVFPPLESETGLVFTPLEMESETGLVSHPWLSHSPTPHWKELWDKPTNQEQGCSVVVIDLATRYQRSHGYTAIQDRRDPRNPPCSSSSPAPSEHVTAFSGALGCETLVSGRGRIQTHQVQMLLPSSCSWQPPP